MTPQLSQGLKRFHNPFEDRKLAQAHRDARLAASHPVTEEVVEEIVPKALEISPPAANNEILQRVTTQIEVTAANIEALRQHFNNQLQSTLLMMLESIFPALIQDVFQDEALRALDVNIPLLSAPALKISAPKEILSLLEDHYNEAFPSNTTLEFHEIDIPGTVELSWGEGCMEISSEKILDEWRTWFASMDQNRKV